MNNPQDDTRPKTSKLTAVITQLDAATLLMLKGFDPRPVHTLIWASRQILWDLHKDTPNPVVADFESSIRRIVKPGHLSEWINYERQTANFLKHADRDPAAVLEGIDVGAINEITFGVCAMALSSHISPIPERIAIGLTFVGFRAGKWFDFRGLCADVGMSDQTFMKYKQMGDKQRVKAQLAAYEHSLEMERYVRVAKASQPLLLPTQPNS